MTPGPSEDITSREFQNLNLLYIWFWSVWWVDPDFSNIRGKSSLSPPHSAWTYRKSTGQVYSTSIMMMMAMMQSLNIIDDDKIFSPIDTKVI